MAEVFLGALVNVLVDRLASGDLWNFARKERIDTQLTKLSSMLEQVQAAVADAEEKQITDRETNLWLSDLEDLSYDMDDVLDEFATEALRQRVMEEPRGSPSKVRKLIPNCCTSFNPSTLVSDFRMKPKMDEMDEITMRLEDKLKESEGDESISKARHSSYTRGDRDGIKKFEAFKKAKNLRTFLPCGSRYQGESCLTSDVPLRLLPGLKRLRVLSLRRYQIGELSNSIGDLKHVRYLDLSCALVLMLPESIGTLYNLQMLILRDCKNLRKLPASTSDLISLRHLDVTGADSLQEMPPKMGKLTSLQTLSNFIVGNGNGSRIVELGSLIHLRGALSISGLENVTDALDARRANLKDKQGLNVLRMEWSNISDNSHNENIESQVLDMLEPHKNLKGLSINGYGGFTFPNWIRNSLFSNIVSLKFKNCEKCTSLPPLGQLPSLAKLYIQGMKAVCNVGLEFYGLGRLNPFPALEILTFDDMPEWKEWTPYGVEEGAQAFARLSELSIKRCPNLSHELPRNLPRLRNLDIEECPVLVVAWIPSPTELNEVRNTLHFDSLVSLHLKNVSIAGSLGSSEVGDQVVLKNSSHSLLSSLTSLKMENIRGHTCLPSWVFQGLTGLQELYLRHFEELTTLWEDEVRLQNRLPTLRCLTIEHCPQLISLFAGGEEGDNLKSLQKLSISHCRSIISFLVLPSTLKELQIRFCEWLVSLPDLTLLNNLEKLDLYFCLSLPYLSSGSGLPPALKELEVTSCVELKSLIAEEGIKINCPSLESIFIYGCDRLKTLPDVMQNNNGLKNLSRLVIWNCKNLESLPKGWFPTTNFRNFDIYSCEKLEPLPNHAYNNNRLASVEELSVGGFPAGTGLLSHILDEGSSSNFTNLTKLTIYDVDIGKLCGLHRLYSLRKLSLENCDWVSFPEDGMLSFPSSLVELGIRRFPNLEKLSFKDFEILVSLERLEIENCPKLTSISELRLPPSLSKLYISDCPELASFPEQGLPPSLSNLCIAGCPELTSFPEQGLPPLLSDLAIYDCPNFASFPEQGLPSSLLGSGGIHGKAANVGANITDKVIADNDRDIAGMDMIYSYPHAKSTYAALVFGSISSFGINCYCNALSLLISFSSILVCLHINCCYFTADATSSPPDAASPVGTPPPPPHVATGRTAARKKAARHGRRKTAARKKATRAADKDPTKQITARKSSAQANIDDSTVAPHSPVSDTPRETSHRSTEIDMGATPADSVKKRRRTASWIIGVNGPTIVSVPDDEGDKSIKRPRKNKSQSLVVYKKKNEIVHGKDDHTASAAKMMDLILFGPETASSASSEN
ncbi:hypothetical protein RHGRI_000503 [Rhododendron griersonianum]|uniref:Rx N-terminal domain-containing protein n=1 Tax=Rhododendron griersonianum TaxID=479676 RepID=A0AAV6LHW7_9ERIC|nr:hypothetical protein RHGRI_000503 [Rhododendron griersonianum]